MIYNVVLTLNSVALIVNVFSLALTIYFCYNYFIATVPIS